MNIFKDGILVDVNVCFWSGAKMLTAQDLGLEEKNIAEAYKLGRKMLIPTDIIKKFRALESKARHIVEQNSFKFPMGSARFVPKRKFPRVLKALKGYQEEYNGLTDSLITNYDELRKKMIPVYREAAKEAFERQVSIGVQTFSIETQDDEKTKFVRNFLYRIKKFYPDPETLRARYSLSWDAYEISMPRLKIADADKIADTQVKEDITNEVYKEQTHKKISAFMDEVVGTLRQKTIEICERVTSNIKNGKVIKGRTVQSLIDFADNFSEFNFVGDAKIENQLVSLKEFLNEYPTPNAPEEEKDMKEELERRLNIVSELASNTTDVNSVTGEYHRKINWKD